MVAKFSVVVVTTTSVVISIIFSAIVLIFKVELSQLFTTDSEVIEAVSNLTPLLAISVFLNGIQPILSGKQDPIFPSFWLWNDHPPSPLNTSDETEIKGGIVDTRYDFIFNIQNYQRITLASFSVRLNGAFLDFRCGHWERMASCSSLYQFSHLLRHWSPHWMCSWLQN